MKHLELLSFLLISFLTINVFSQSNDYVSTTPKSGDGIINLLKRYGLPDDKDYVEAFKELNKNNLTQNDGLFTDKTYFLPISIYKYNGTSIRSTIGNNDWDYAVIIQKYNEKMTSLGIKENDYRQDKILWVPMLEITGESTDVKKENKPKVKNNIYPIFGKKYEKVSPISNKLSGMIFYIVGGHGGPDPGAIGFQAGYELHEDEYAYDVSLRLARKLLEHGAEVKIIVQDENDGIRDDRYLNNSDKEKYIGGIEIPRNQLARLQKRAEIINNIYYENSKTAKSQYVIITHVDSRITNKMIDIFFYYKENSAEGSSLANTLLETIEDKYHKAQPGRGYEGSVSSRNLYMLRKTIPISIYIELGNIQNDRDQKRILEVNNRQAIANWLTDGIINHINNYKD